MENSNIQNFINQFKELSCEDLEKLSSVILELILGKKFTDINNVSTECKYCKSTDITKYGKNKGIQRYWCNDCSRTFSKSFVRYLHKTHYEKFIKFIECALKNESIPTIAQTCKISQSCAFEWRHKLFNLIFTHFSAKIELKGLIESDEIYFRNSDKGNFKNGIGRKPRRHGYCPGQEDRAGLSTDKLCVVTGMDRSSNILVDFIGFGKPSTQKLYEVYKDKIVVDSDTVLIVDGEKSYRPLSELMNLKIEVLLKDSKNSNSRLPVINGDFHIQNVNNFHGQIKEIVNRKYKGVGSKYLLLYINWVKWLRINKAPLEELIQNLKNFTSSYQEFFVTNGSIQKTNTLNL